MNTLNNLPASFTDATQGVQTIFVCDGCPSNPFTEGFKNWQLCSQAASFWVSQSRSRNQTILKGHMIVEPSPTHFQSLEKHIIMRSESSLAWPAPIPRGWPCETTYTLNRAINHSYRDDSILQSVCYALSWRKLPNLIPSRPAMITFINQGARHDITFLFMHFCRPLQWTALQYYGRH